MSATYAATNTSEENQPAMAANGDPDRDRRDDIFRTLPIALIARHPEAPFTPLFVSEGIEAVTGFAPETFVRKSGFLTSRIHPDDAGKAAAALAAAADAGSYRCEYRWLCADGRQRSLLEQGERGIDGQLLGLVIDVTERRLLDEQDAQARKMEAVGRLTGGVAHDLNNLLTVVLGNIDMLVRHPQDGEARTRRMEAVRLAAERGRDLMRQLLVFSRRQHLSPVTLDAAEQIREMDGLLRQTLGPDVALELDLQPIHVSLDPVQFDTTLVNLTINARDAMPDGGTLTIATRRDGDTALIEFHDTGAGMTAEVREHAFEPFFTTKQTGKGSGLGLSQVYGFLRQSGGQVDIESRPGEGAVIRLTLPRSASAALAPGARRAASQESGGERVLVVEDDPAVLALACDLLSEMGYEVTTATDARQALEVLRGKRPVDLLFSDIVMPGGLNGVGLARQAQALRPDLPILLTSGFVGEGSVLGANEYPLIDKPYEATALASTIRSLLDHPGGAEASA